ncbi:MAG: AI-2E family transporter, partial [Eubacterium sp.]|nr:AI-2E family transporter [Eubacterium sp.]
MPEKVEKRREFLINIFFIAVILALVYVFFKYLFWAAAPFILTFLIAIILQKPIRWLDKKSKRNLHTFWSIISVVLIIVVIVVPLGFILSSVISKISDVVSNLVAQLNDIPSFLATLENKLLNLGKFLPDAIYRTYSSSITDTFTKLIDDFDLSSLGIDMSSVKSGVSTGISGIFGVVKNIPSIA